jgi:hypothetical protein
MEITIIAESHKFLTQSLKRKKLMLEDFPNCRALCITNFYLWVLQSTWEYTRRWLPVCGRQVTWNVPKCGWAKAGCPKTSVTTCAAATCCAWYYGVSQPTVLCPLSLCLLHLLTFPHSMHEGPGHFMDTVEVLWGCAHWLPWCKSWQKFVAAAG